MKTTKRLRLLSLLGFLLLMAPFYDSCDNRKNSFLKSYDEYDANGKLIEKTFFKTSTMLWWMNYPLMDFK
jgi:hypothetical protein